MNKSYTAFTPVTFPLPSSSANTALICPYWADANPNYGGNVWSRETTDPALLQAASIESKLLTKNVTYLISKIIH